MRVSSDAPDTLALGVRRATRLLREWGLNCKAKFSCMKTVVIEQAVEQTNATKVFTYKGLGAEHRAAGDHLFHAFISQAIFFTLLRYAR